MKGWTIDQWRSTQLASTPDEALNRLIELVKGIDNTNPRYISIASPDQIREQWDVLSGEPEVCLWCHFWGFHPLLLRS